MVFGKIPDVTGVLVKKASLIKFFKFQQGTTIGRFCYMVGLSDGLWKNFYKDDQSLFCTALVFTSHCPQVKVCFDMTALITIFLDHV